MSALLYNCEDKLFKCLLCFTTVRTNCSNVCSALQLWGQTVQMSALLYSCERKLFKCLLCFTAVRANCSNVCSALQLWAQTVQMSALLYNCEGKLFKCLFCFTAVRANCSNICSALTLLFIHNTNTFNPKRRNAEFMLRSYVTYCSKLQFPKNTLDLVYSVVTMRSKCF